MKQLDLDRVIDFEDLILGLPVDEMVDLAQQEADMKGLSEDSSAQIFRALQFLIQDLLLDPNLSVEALREVFDENAEDWVVELAYLILQSFNVDPGSAEGGMLVTSLYYNLRGLCPDLFLANGERVFSLDLHIMARVARKLKSHSESLMKDYFEWEKTGDPDFRTFKYSDESQLFAMARDARGQMLLEMATSIADPEERVEFLELAREMERTDIHEAVLYPDVIIDKIVDEVISPSIMSWVSRGGEVRDPLLAQDIISKYAHVLRPMYEMFADYWAYYFISQDGLTVAAYNDVNDPCLDLTSFESFIATLVRIECMGMSDAEQIEVENIGSGTAMMVRYVLDEGFRTWRPFGPPEEPEPLRPEGYIPIYEGDE